MNLVVLLIIAIIFRMGFDIFVSRAGGRINSVIGNGIFSGIASVLPLFIYMLSKAGHDSTVTTKAGVAYSILAGVCVAAFSIILIRLYAQGGNVSYVTPIIYGGTIIGVSLVGWLVFKEPFSLLELAGVVAIAAGVGMVVASRA